MPLSFGAGVRDSLSNLAASLGTARDKAAHDAFAVVELGRAQIEAMYRGDWLARKVVDIVPYDSVRAWRSWSGHRADVARFEAAERRLGLWGTVQRAMTLGRLYGGGAVLIGDGETDVAALARPLDPRLPRGGLAYLHAVSRWQLGVSELDLNPLSPWCGEPKGYALSSPGRPALELHPSRVVRFLGNPLPDPSHAGALWSDSVLQSLYDAVHAAALSLAGATSLLHEAKVDVVTVPNLSEHLTSAETTEQLSARFAYAAAMKSINNLLLLGDGESWSRQRVDFAGLPEMARTFLQVAAGAADIPVTRLLGQSPSGLSATGESDVRNYYDMIAARQELDLRPQLERLDRLICRSEGIDEGALTFAFRPLWQMDEPAKAALALSKAQATQVYAGLKLWPDAVMARLAEAQLVADGTYPNAAALFADRDGPDPDGTTLTLDFDPDQPRDPDGRWTAGTPAESASRSTVGTSAGATPGVAPTTKPLIHPTSSGVGEVSSSLRALDPIETAQAQANGPDERQSSQVPGTMPAKAEASAPDVPTRTTSTARVEAETDPVLNTVMQQAIVGLAPLVTLSALRQRAVATASSLASQLSGWLVGGPPPDPPPSARTAGTAGGGRAGPAGAPPRALTIHGEAGSAALPGFSPAPPSAGLPPSVAVPPAGQSDVPGASAPASDPPFSLSQQAEDPEEKAQQEKLREELERDFDNIKQHITDKDVFGAWAESKEKQQWTKRDGTAYDHQAEIRDAQNGLKTTVLRIKGLLGRRRLLPSEAGPLQDLLGRASRALDRTEDYLPRPEKETETGDGWVPISPQAHDL